VIPERKNSSGCPARNFHASQATYQMRKSIHSRRNTLRPADSFPDSLQRKIGASVPLPLPSIRALPEPSQTSNRRQYQGLTVFPQ
jgi:hypothetical protein